MAHFAEIRSSDNVVVNVVKVNDEDLTNNGGEYTTESETWVSNNVPSSISEDTYWKQTSYNTRAGKYYDSFDGWGEGERVLGDQTKAKRKNYAGIGFTYDSTRDAFIPTKQVSTYVLNENSCTYVPHVAYPADETKKWRYFPDQDPNWVEVTDGSMDDYPKESFFGDW